MKEYLTEKLHNGRIFTKILLARARLNEVRDWDTPTMNDPKYLPFYYYLGSQLKSKNVIELGFGLGLTSSALIQGCPSIEKYVGYQITKDDFYYSTRLGNSTLKEYFKGNIKIDFGDTVKFEELVITNIWDLGLITQKVDERFLRRYMDKIWKNLSSEALIVVDHLQESSRMEIFNDWCDSINHKPDIYDTRYTLGIVTKR